MGQWLRFHHEPTTSNHQQRWRELGPYWTPFTGGKWRELSTGRSMVLEDPKLFFLISNAWSLELLPMGCCLICYTIHTSFAPVFQGLVNCCSSCSLEADLLKFSFVVSLTSSDLLYFCFWLEPCPMLVNFPQLLVHDCWLYYLNLLANWGSRWPLAVVVRYWLSLFINDVLPITVRDIINNK